VKTLAFSNEFIASIAWRSCAMQNGCRENFGCVAEQAEHPYKVGYVLVYCGGLALVSRKP
jgi:hypothetical protein